MKSGEIWFEGRELLGLKEEEMRKIRGKNISMILLRRWPISGAGR